MSMDMTARLGADISGFTSAMNRVRSTMRTIGESTGQVSEQIGRLNGAKFKEIGSNVSDAGKKMSLFTAPIAAAGIAAIKIGSDFQQGMAQVQAVSGASGKELESLTSLARDLGSTTKYSANEAAGGMEMLARAGFNTSEIVSAMPGMLDLAASSAIDLSTAADVTSNILSGFGMSADNAGKVADILATASANANVDVNSLGEAMKTVSPIAASLGVSLEDTSAAIGIMGDAGIAGSQAGNMLKRGLLNLSSPSKQAGDLMEKLGISVFDAEGNMKSMPDVINELEDGLEGMSAQQKISTLETMFGSEAVAGWSALIDSGSDNLADFSSELSNSSGQAKKMADVMNNTVQGKLLAMKSALEEVAIVIFQALEPALYKVIEVVTKAAQWFQNLSPAVTLAVVALGGILVAIGPILMIVGTLISSIGSIITVFGAMSAAITGAGGIVGVFGAIIAAITSPIGLTVIAIAALAAGVVLLVNHFSKDAIDPIVRFGDEVSESTQKAVGAFMDMSEKADVALKEIVWSQQEMTAEMAANMITGQQEITDTLLTAIGERHAKETEATKEQFANLDMLTEEQKMAIIAKTNMRFAEEAVAVEEGNALINEIIQTAADEKRALTTAESDDILAIRQNMTEQAVVMMSENEVEQKAILERMKDNASTITALEAAEVVRNSKQKKDDVIAEANEQYDETHRWAIRQRDELGTLSAEEAKAVIDEAKNKRDKTVGHAETMHKDVVKEAKAQAKDHINEVNWETGEILSKWKIFTANVGKFFSDLGKALADSGKAMWTATADWFSKIYTSITTYIKDAGTDALKSLATLLNDAKAKFESIRSSASEKFLAAKKAIVDPIEEAKTKIGTAIDAVKGFFQNLSLKFPKIQMPKMPKITLEIGVKTIMGKEISYPKGFGVSWHAKGGIFNKPTLLGDGSHGVGEAGAEAVIPLSKSVLGTIGDKISSTMNNNQESTPAGDTYNIIFQVDKMTGSEADVTTFTKQFQDRIKRNRGVR